MILTQGPSHGYEIIKTLNFEYGDIRLNTVYRWLHELEDMHLIAGKIQDGPRGPKRRVYRITHRGKKYTISILQDALRVIMQFYEDFRHSVGGYILETLETSTRGPPEGRALLAAFPKVLDQDLAFLELLDSRYNQTRLEVMGATKRTSMLKKKYQLLSGNICDIPSRRNRFSEIWLLRIPSRADLPTAVLECKRVLMKEGVLKIIAPFVYFNEPQQPNLCEFMRITAIHHFPELGFVDGNEVGAVVDSFFGGYEATELFPNFVVFEATNRS